MKEDGTVRVLADNESLAPPPSDVYAQLGGPNAATADAFWETADAFWEALHAVERADDEVRRVIAMKAAGEDVPTADFHEAQARRDHAHARFDQAAMRSGDEARRVEAQARRDARRALRAAHRLRSRPISSGCRRASRRTTRPAAVRGPDDDPPGEPAGSSRLAAAYGRWS